MLSDSSVLVNGQHKAWRQYTVNDGLPGNEVFDMLQDSKGFMWFVTNQGICRFNGYEFSRPVDTSALAGTEAFIPTEDNEGRIWFSRINKTLWYIENDTVRAWEYNYILDQFKKKFSVIDQLGLDTDGTVWAALASDGFLCVKQDGTYHFIKTSQNQNVVFADIRHHIEYAFQTDRHIPMGKRDTLEIYYSNGDSLQLIDQFKHKVKTLAGIGVWPIENEKILIGIEGEYFIYHNRKLETKFHSKIIAEKIIQMGNGSLLVASHFSPNSGLFFFSSMEKFIHSDGQNLLTGFLVTDVYEDHEGGWWATTKNAGLFYTKNPDLDIFDVSSGLPVSNVLSLTNDGKNFVWGGLQTKEIIKINCLNDQLDVIQPPVQLFEMSSIWYNPIQQQLWIGNPLYHYQENDWIQILSKENPDGFSKVINVKELSPERDNSILWISSTFGFIKVNTNSYVAKVYSEVGPLLTAQRTFSVVSDPSGTIWVATIKGLQVWKKDHYELPPFSHPALRFLARDIELLKDGGIAFGFAGAGILIQNADGQLTQLTTRNRLSSDFITKIAESPIGEIYACSNSGLNKLTISNRNQWKIKTIGIKQGLPSNLINDVTCIDNEIWVATDKGIAHMKSFTTSSAIPAPQLENFMVNDRAIAYNTELRFPHDQNNITIQYYSLHFRSAGDILYRYRFSQDTIYQITNSRQANFPNLSPGRFKFEVQAQNEDGSWGTPSSWSFEIKRPWWKTWWFYSLLTGMFLFGARTISQIRVANVRKKSELDTKIRDLELAALRAQMNPHFIFNCLGSIQQFIAENDSDSATRYLARFAKLVRLSLHSSVDGKHSLAEEVEMLDNYLALEQMRFKGKFTYTISTDLSLNPEDIYLPPMLVQPFVENAILHGIKNKSDGGKIKVEFGKKNKTLQVLITDNGPGFPTNHHQDEKAHKSIGTTLTERRLDILSGSSAEKNFTIENITNEDNEIQGSKVVIQIPVD